MYMVGATGVSECASRVGGGGWGFTGTTMEGGDGVSDRFLKTFPDANIQAQTSNSPASAHTPSRWIFRFSVFRC